jgi:peptide/nickel transport system permease protein
MSRYFVQRLLLVLPTLIGVTLITFTLIRLVPGGTVSALLGPTATPQQAAELRHALGLDRPIWQQYVTWVGGLLHGSLGKSLLEQSSIAHDLSQRIGWTFELGALALSISLLVALPIGVLAAIRQDSLWDYVARSAAIAFLAIPSFWLGTMLIVYGSMGLDIGGISLHFTPPLGNEIGDSLGQNLQLVLPAAIILGIGLSGSVMRLTRTQMLEVMRQDYIRTAQAKGLGVQRVIVRHALRNAFIPVITIIGLQIPVLIGGSVVLEQIFSLPGVGNYLVNAISQRDLTVIQAVVLLSAFVVILSNLVVDMAYTALDPRLRGAAR